MALYSTLQKFITKEGAPVEGASVNVKLSGGAVDAELFATRTGTAKSNPFLTTANGEALCYVKAGRYDMTVTKGTDQIAFKDVEVGPVSNVGTFADGGTITDPDQLVEDADGNKWRWTGNLNYNFSAGENPNSIAEWIRYIDFGLPKFKTVAEMKSYSNLKYFPSGTRIEWQGYYTQSDGGSNWGVLRFGAHTEDGGSIFSIDANTYIEANLKGKSVNVLKFGVKTGGSDNTLIYDAIKTSGFLSWYFPSGQYYGQLKLIAGLAIVGESNDNTTIQYDNDFVVGTNGTRQDGWKIDSITIDGMSSPEVVGILSTNYSSKYTVTKDVKINNVGLWAFWAKGGLDFKFYASGINTGRLTSTGEGGFAFVDTVDGTDSGGVATTYDVGGYAQAGGRYGYKVFRSVLGVISGKAEYCEIALHARSCSSLRLDNFYCEANTDTGNVITLIDCNGEYLGGRFQEDLNISWFGSAGKDRFFTGIDGTGFNARSFNGAKINLKTTGAVEATAEEGDFDSKSGVARAYDKSSGSMQAIMFRFRGTTSQRPSPSAGDIGYTYYDTDLGSRGLPIWWAGSAWIDASGNVV